MEKVASVFNYQLMGNLSINQAGEKPSFVSPTLENKVNYFVILDYEQGVQGSPPVPKFCYYPVKFEIVGGRLFLRKYPGILADGILMLARFNSVRVGHGEALLLVTVLAIFLGGIDPFGGHGKVAPVILSVLILQILSSGLNLIGANQHLATAVWGLFLIAVMILRSDKLANFSRFILRKG